MPGPLVDPRSLRDALAREESRLLHLKTELGHTQARLAELKTTLAAHGQPVETSPSAPSTASEKVALFRSRFRGRDDIYPKFWSNARTGRKGYAPACGNEWVRGVCEKPRVKCGECPNQAFLPVDDKIILDHLQGPSCRWGLPVADRRNVLVPRSGFRQGVLDRRRGRLHGDLSSAWSPRSRRAITLRQRRPRLVLLLGTGGCVHGASDGLLLTPTERRAATATLASIPDGESRLLIATGRYIGEGFDDARLDTFFLAMPVSWKGTLVQYAGRLHRLHPGKITPTAIGQAADSPVPLARDHDAAGRCDHAISARREGQEHPVPRQNSVRGQVVDQPV
jgi:hypothetical protein